MIIPKGGKDRDKQLKFIIDVCSQSRNDRMALYARRRNYFLYGSNQGAGTLHNRLYAHLDLVSSFLYTPDHAKYAIAPPEHSDDALVEQLIALGDYWNDTFRDSELAYQYSDALTWATVYDTMYIKMGWNNATKELYGEIVPPYAMGMWNETKPGIDNQQAFVHSYVLDYDEAVQRLYRAGLASEIKRMEVNFGRDEEDMPPVLHNLLLGGPFGPSITDPLTGVVNSAAEPTPTYRAQTDVPLVKWHEVTVWDDQFEDYAQFTVATPDMVISDSRETIAALKNAKRGVSQELPSESNIFLPGDHPFIEIQPYQIYDYAWGLAHIEKLIPLQQWSDKRMGEIQTLLARQVDPAKVFSGFSGLLDEKAAALGGPGTWVMDQIPGAKVDELKPEIPEDCFAELKEIGAIFLEASGLTETLQGRGEQGVRGRGHAKQLQGTGSGRIRKVAVGLERSLSKLGDIGLRLLMRNSEDKLLTEKKQAFVPAQVGGEYKIRIAGHSHSPLFRDETKDDAIVMLKAQAIDQEALIDILNPANALELKYKLRKRIKAKAEQAKAMMAAGINPDEGKGKPKLKAV